MFCSKCGAEVSDSSAAFCPKCGNKLVESQAELATPASQATARPRKRRTRVGWVVLAIIVLIVVSALSSNNSQDTAPSTTSAPASTASSTTSNATSSDSAKSAPKTKSPPGIGDSHETGTWRITVNSAYTAQVLDEHDNEFLRQVAGEGETFVVVDVTFENITKKTQSFSSLLEAPKIVTSDGYEYDVDWDASLALKHPFEDGDVTPGLKKRGQWAFKVRSDAKGLRFRIEFFSKPYEWYLSDSLPQ